MLGFLIVLLLLLSVLLIIAVLLQPGKGDMLTGGLGGLGGTFTSMFGTRQATTLLQKITIGFAAAILLLSLLANRFFVGQQDLMPRPVTEGYEVPTTVPQSPSQTPMPPPAPPQD